MLLKPLEAEELRETPAPILRLASFSSEPVNQLDTLLKNNSDVKRLDETNSKGALAILSSIGAVAETSSSTKEKEDPKSNARKVFSDAGATLENSAKAIVEVMKFATKDNEKLAAARLVATIHGALEDLETQKAPVVNISIMPLNLANNNSILNLVVPR